MADQRTACQADLVDACFIQWEASQVGAVLQPQAIQLRYLTTLRQNAPGAKSWG